MAETRKQFYRRMEVIADTSALIEDRSSEIRSELLMGMRDAAAQGYAQALRDVLGMEQLVNITYRDFRAISPVVHAGDIREWAADRDLDLEDTP